MGFLFFLTVGKLNLTPGSSPLSRLWRLSALSRGLGVTPRRRVWLILLGAIFWVWSSHLLLYMCAFPLVVSSSFLSRPVASSSQALVAGVGHPLLGPPFLCSPLDPRARGRLTAVPLCPCGREFPARKNQVQQYVLLQRLQMETAPRT